MDPMSRVSADPDAVIRVLSNRIAELTARNAVLEVALAEARRESEHLKSPERPPKPSVVTNAE